MRKRLLISAIALAAVAAAGQTVPHGSLGFDVQIDTNLFLLNPSEIVTTPDGTLAGYATVQDLHAAANAATNHSAANLNIAVGHADSLTNALWNAIGGKQDRLPYPTNAIPFDVIAGGAYGVARPLPRYLHCLDFDGSYPEDASWYYARRSGEPVGCSAVRVGNTLSRNFDFPFDDRAEFVVKMSAGTNRFASVGVADVGMNLTESFVASGRPSRFYKCLPGATVDGINEKGVVAVINVIDGPVTNGWQTGGDIHPLAAVRWVLDNATDAQTAAEYLAAHIKFPDGWGQNYHYMVADALSTYIIENGAAHEVTGRAVMTNFRLYPSRDMTGAGQERYNILMDPTSNITDAWYTRAYLRTTDWESEFRDADEMEAAKAAWETHSRDELRGHGLWQTVHTSVYDITNRVLRICVQEIQDSYVFQVPFPGERYVNNVLNCLNDIKLDKTDIDGLSADATIGAVVDKLNEIAAAFNPQEDEE